MATNFKLKGSYYHASTPAKIRKIGDAILIAGPVIGGSVMGLPISENSKLWINFGISGLTVVGKIITNFFTDQEIANEEAEEQAEETPATPPTPPAA